MNNPAVKEHHKGSNGPYNFAIITISSSRFEKHGSVASPHEADDSSGQVMETLILRSGHRISHYRLVDDDPESIAGAVLDAVGSKADIVITSGGTGLTSRDVTIESVVPMFSKQMQGFGELFRYKSIDQIGTSVILTRASAGVISGKAVFCLPGSPAAVELAIGGIIIPEAGHIMKHVRE
ncbi:molybdenum cofactor biosynthesis protein B [Methanolobus sp.]|uniref:MogA/MoaB family molybdenum cofactor biosynthesis protein n=1 Tax=Methanolobus sp. TaxID=1874737 RepID=UPI0025E94349|nr:molybdenum cofactor biosynthesis protein B [Methanolobus sp.]